MQCKLYSWGGAQEVTGSKHFLETENGTLMIDCGAFQGRRDECDRKNRNWAFNPESVTAAILTHAHYDHCGLLPRFIAEGYKNSVYCTSATMDLAKLVMMDSARIQKHDFEYMHKKNKKFGTSHKPKEPLYTEDEVFNCMGHFSTVAYHKQFAPLQGVNATLYDAGHILGSSMAFLEVKNSSESFRIGFSGDLGRNGLPIIRNPEVLPPLDYLVLESTYGNRLHDPMNFTLDKLANIINRVADRRGKIIIPAFAIERTQELVFFIHLLHDQKRIPKIPVYIDSPMSADATTIFKMHEECYDQKTVQAFIDHHENPFGFSDLIYLTTKEESQALNEQEGPMIIISSSGMCEHGRILHHLAHSVRDPRNALLIVGYMAENTLGRRIVERINPIRIFGEEYYVKCEVTKLNSFSGHADYQEILDYLASMDTSSLRKIFLIHGEKEAQANLKMLLEAKGHKTDIIVPGVDYQL
ncbi:MAG TPA: MBL fold metallo-hydrolase [Lentisphaeria bacterium]|nr:MAG: MBL fold metallo-hydrolase [Lentisphaerae bacterium GWF2_38_69]HBM15938.1 MBL fold metallo-hydrolase [Lentisphaeria bacterium]